MNFVAIDFETATPERHSACELGLCIVEDFKIVKTKSWLIKPPSFPYFNRYNMAVHGIQPADVASSPTFDEVWHEAEKLIYGHLMLAHNAAFDASVLRSSLNYYGFFHPKINYLCSIQIAKHSWKNLPKYGLKALAEHLDIKFNHHRAGDDAEVCAKIAISAFQRLMITRPEEAEIYFGKKIKLL